MNLEKFMECSKNLTETELKDIRNYINRELNRRSKIDKPVYDSKNPHRTRTFYFTDQEIAISFFDKYEPKHIVHSNGLKTGAGILFRDLRYLFRYPEPVTPEDWRAKVTICLDMTTFKEIKDTYKLSKFRREKYRKDGSKYYYSPDSTYIVEEVE